MKTVLVISVVVLVLLALIGRAYMSACENERARIGGSRFTLLTKPSIWQVLLGPSNKV